MITGITIAAQNIKIQAGNTEMILKIHSGTQVLSTLS